MVSRENIFDAPIIMYVTSMILIALKAICVILIYVLSVSHGRPHESAPGGNFALTLGVHRVSNMSYR